MPSCFLFLAVLQNSKGIVNASKQIHQKKFCFFVFKNYTMSKRFLKSWFVESWKIIILATVTFHLKIFSSNSKLDDQSGSRILSPALWLVNQHQQIHGGNFKLKGHVTRSVSYKSSNLFGHVWWNQPVADFRKHLQLQQIQMKQKIQFLLRYLLVGHLKSFKLYFWRYFQEVFYLQ